MVTNFNSTDMVQFGQFCVDLKEKGMLFPNEKISTEHFDNWKLSKDMEKKRTTALDDAELLIMRLPIDDPKRQDWLIKNGKGLEADELRKRDKLSVVVNAIESEKPTAKWVSYDGYENHFSCETSIGYIHFATKRDPNVNPESSIPAIELIAFIKIK